MGRAQRTDPDPGAGRGRPLAFGNVYANLAELIRARREERTPGPLALDYPSAEDGLHSLRVIRASVASAGAAGAWTDI